MTEIAEFLGALVARRVDPAARTWLEHAREAVADHAALAEAFTATARRVGKRPLDVSDTEIAEAVALGVTWPMTRWTVDEVARITILLGAAARLALPELEDVATDCYRRGDNREHQAVLRAFAFLPDSKRFLETAIDACRTSIQPIFEAIACENPYPATHFPDLNFNQMVLKALFTGVALDRIVGLDGRLTPELARMARGYASERRAARRSVPADIGRLTGERDIA